MCGIVGVAQYKSGVPREVRQKALKILFSETMLRTETRGEDATGVYQVHQIRPGEDYGDWAMAKKGIKVSEWLFQNGEKTEDPVVYSDFMDAWLDHDQDLTALVGHCRKATIGSRGRDNDDNHPFAVQLDERNALLGVHNGTLNNHEKIFGKLPKMLKRQGRVDSEAIFHLLFHLSEHGTKPIDGDMLKMLGHRLDGSFACIAVNTRFPHIIATFREGRPLEYFMITPLNIVIAASIKGFVESALDKYEFIRKMFMPELPELKWDDRTLLDRDYRIFDTSKEFPLGKPGLNDFDKISDKGEMRKYGDPVDSEWKSSTTSTTSKSTNTSNYSGSSRAGSQSSTITPKTSKAGEGKTAQLAASAGPTKGDDDEITTIEVEIGGEDESKKSFERVKSLGVCVQYANKREIASSLGTTETALDKLSVVEVANLVGQTLFNLGYAACKFDDKSQTDDVRKKGSALTKKLERAETKQQRAQNHVWEQKQVITIILSLIQSGYPVTVQNISIALSAFPDLSEERRKDIRAMAANLLGDKNVRKTADALSEAYKKASEKNQKRSRQKAIEAAERD